MKNPIVSQWNHPRGVLGQAAGLVMAWANGARSAWALEKLAPQNGEKILEIGFGPGVDLKRIARAVGTRGFVGGVDVSIPMLRQATRRNQRLINEGRVIVQLGNATGLPYPESTFHAVYAVGAAHLWPDLGRSASEIRRVLRARGRVVLVVPGGPKGAEHWRDTLTEHLKGAGFSEVQGDLDRWGRWAAATGRLE
jgi:ubiquinone/menaquinone biosynthesis C-methylase UbiE